MNTLAYLGRQAIYNSSVKVEAYELLYRAGEHLEARIDHADAATARVILHAVADFGLERVVGDKPAYINVPRGFLLSDLDLPIAPARVVLEVLEDVEPDERLVQRVQRLAQQGYRIALDDFVYHPAWRPLLELASVVKLDYRALGPRGVEQQLELLRPCRYKLLAEKIETHGEFEHCKELGFQLFQGYFLSRPQVLEGRSLAPQAVHLLRLLAELCDPGASTAQICETVAHDTALSLLLIRHVNSVVYPLAQPLCSVHDVVVYLGSQRVQNLASLLLLGQLSDKPSDLARISMVRAKMCELLGTARLASNPHGYFTVGMFSTLDAMFDQPLGLLMKQLPLAEELQEALLTRTGDMGDALRCVLAYERGDWQRAQLAGVDQQQVCNAFVAAAEWANEAEIVMAARA